MSNTTTPPNNDNNDDDQDLANNLQEQYRLEFLQRQARKNSQARATAPIGMMGETPVAAAAAAASADGDIEIDLSSTNMNNTDNDADLARRLQEEFNGGGGGGITTTTTTSAFGYTVGADDHRISINPFDRLEDNTNTNTTTNNNNNDDDEDARMAQQLQDEEWARQYSQMEQSSQRQRQQLRGQHTTTSSSSFLDEQDDAATRDARRIAQEMNDAEIAQRLTLYEQEALTRRQVLEAQQQNQQNTRTQFWMGRLLPLLCCAGILTITLLFVFDVLDSEDISFFRGFDPDDWVESDPWSGGGGGSTDDNIRNDDFTPVQDDESFRWQNDGKSGLKLEILNALDDSWQSTFQKAVADWDNGMPIDALILTTKQVDYDMSCKAVQGKLKVCNGNYGDTKWRGLNEVLLSRNRIESSSAKMNEYYLKHDNDDQKLYTMCHEVGHGFGLPHWDEDFLNPDLGNCMDYTKNPQNNKQPDASNFEFLGELYGGKNTTAVAEGVPPKNRKLLVSKLRLDPKDNIVGDRRILIANDHSEVHWERVDDQHVKLYHYLLAWEAAALEDHNNK